MNIDFYVLEAASSQQCHFFACQLLEKFYAEKKLPIFVHTDTRAEAERFDALLWTWKDDSFIPHQIYTKEAFAPILIGDGETPALPQAVVFNLGKEIPAFFQQSGHVIEFVFNDPLVQQLARQRFKKYRDLGLNINTIKNK